MEKASNVLYTIANIFNWIALVLGVMGIIFAAMGMAGVDAFKDMGTTQSLVLSIWTVIFAIILIIMTRVAKAKGTSKGWDILFMVVGIVGGNIFYFLAGLFGIIARRD